MIRHGIVYLVCFFYFCTCINGQVDPVWQAYYDSTDAYWENGDYDGAIDLLLKSKLQLERSLANYDLDSTYNLTLDDIGTCHFYMGRYNKALEFLQIALDNAERSIGRDHADFGSYLNNVAAIYIKMGRYEEALPLCLEVLENAERNLGREHDYYGIYQNTLANLYQELGLYKDALPLFLELADYFSLE